MYPSSASRIFFIEKSHIGMCTKDHNTHVIYYTIIGIGGDIVNQEMYQLFGGYGGLGLSRRYGTECH